MSISLLAVRRVTQDNRGKKTAGVDGVKSLTPMGEKLSKLQNSPKPGLVLFNLWRTLIQWRGNRNPSHNPCC